MQLWKLNSLEITELDYGPASSKKEREVIELQDIYEAIQVDSPLKFVKIKSHLPWNTKEAEVVINGEEYLLPNVSEFHNLINHISANACDLKTIVMHFRIGEPFAEEPMRTKYMEALRTLMASNVRIPHFKYRARVPMDNVLSVHQIPFAIKDMSLGYCLGTSVCNVSFEVHEG